MMLDVAAHSQHSPQSAAIQAVIVNFIGFVGCAHGRIFAYMIESAMCPTNLNDYLQFVHVCFVCRLCLGPGRICLLLGNLLSLFS